MQHNDYGISTTTMVCLRKMAILWTFVLLVFPGYAQSPDTLQCDSITSDTLEADVPVPEYKRVFPLALKTNLLYDALTIANLGIEFRVAPNWSLGLEWMYAWWSSDKHHRYWQGYGGYLTARYYFSPRPRIHGTTPNRPLYTGHHVGAYALGMTYDVEWGGKGYQASRFGYGCGLEYGYTLPIARQLCLDFLIGVGFQDGEYKVYEPMDGHYVWQSTHKRRWFGPTRAEVSLIWQPKRKGGGR